MIGHRQRLYIVQCYVVPVGVQGKVGNGGGGVSAVIEGEEVLRGLGDWIM
jgi:hypothetical protein